MTSRVRCRTARSWSRASGWRNDLVLNSDAYLLSVGPNHIPRQGMRRVLSPHDRAVVYAIERRNTISKVPLSIHMRYLPLKGLPLKVSTPLNHILVL